MKTSASIAVPPRAPAGAARAADTAAKRLGCGSPRAIRRSGAWRAPSLPLLLSVLAFLPLSAPAAEPPAKLSIFVSILPQSWFVERVGGDRVNVSVLVGPGRSPHSFEPTPKQMASLASAKVLFTVGMPFESALVSRVQSAFPGVLVVDTRKGIELRAITSREAIHAHSGHSDDEHSAGDPDPHFWLSPRLAAVMARTMCDTLKTLDPAGSAVYDANLAALDRDIDAVDKRIAAALAPWKGGEFFVYHPAFGYFADAYGLRQVPVEIEGKEPGARQLAALISQAKSTGVRIIFVQPQFSDKSARAVADAVNGVVVPIDALAPDYLDNLQKLASRIESAIRPASSTVSSPDPAQGVRR